MCHILLSLVGWFRLLASVLSFLFFTDMLIYWIHRGLHHRLLYKVESFVGERQKILISGTTTTITVVIIIISIIRGIIKYSSSHSHDRYKVHFVCVLLYGSGGAELKFCCLEIKKRGIL